MKIYLDNCCFNRPFDCQAQIRIQLETQAKLYIQEKIRDGKYDLIWSYILDYENSANPFLERKQTIALWEKYASYDISPNDKILKSANEIMEFGIKEKDALHVACALSINCDYFITCDDELIKKSKQLKINVINPLEFITLINEEVDNA